MAGSEGVGREGVDRRTLIKGAAVAGAAAWTAPMIVDSLISPAAALSGGINLSGPSYAMIVFDKGGSRYVLKITKSSCANTNDFSGDIGNFTIGSCGVGLRGERRQDRDHQRNLDLHVRRQRLHLHPQRVG